MTLQPRPSNPIEQRKQAVRRYSRNAVVYASAGLLGGAGVALLAGAWWPLVLGLIVAVAGGWVNYARVRKIVNYRDEY